MLALIYFDATWGQRSSIAWSLAITANGCRVPTAGARVARVLLSRQTPGRLSGKDCDVLHARGFLARHVGGDNKPPRNLSPAADGPSAATCRTRPDQIRNMQHERPAQLGWFRRLPHPLNHRRTGMKDGRNALELLRESLDRGWPRANGRALRCGCCHPHRRVPQSKRRPPS